MRRGNDDNRARRGDDDGRSWIGALVAVWRSRRGLSQLALAREVGLAQRNLSFIESGRSRPRRSTVDRLAEAMDIPARKRNALHVAAGFPPCYPELGLASEAVAPYRFAVERLLQVHEPCPAFAIDRWWNVVTANEGAVRFTALFGPPPADLLTGMLAPGPIREALENYAEVAATIMRRLRREVADAAPDGKLQQMLDRVQRLVGPLPATTGETGDLLVCPRFRVHGQTIATVSMIARFGQAREVSLDELRIELLYPADAVGEAFFRNLADAAVPRAALPGIT